MGRTPTPLCIVEAAEALFDKSAGPLPDDASLTASTPGDLGDRLARGEEQDHLRANDGAMRE
jgi:hypothetical protein